MKKLTTDQIQQAAFKLLLEQKSGLRFQELAKRIHALGPETPINTVNSTLTSLTKHEKIKRPSRGLWMHIDNYDPATDDAANPFLPQQEGSKLKTNISEAEFYESFRTWLVNDLEEVTDAVVVGGAVFKSKWGTPDVIGVKKPKTGDLVKFPIEIVSAEIKIDPTTSITAFGQVCAYRLFSHKTYIVMPNTIQTKDLERLEALCSIYGVGLVTFSVNVQSPDYRAEVRAQRFEPDFHYVNELAHDMHRNNSKEFNRLF